MATKKLAKELGLLRQRSQSSNGAKKSLVSNQIFSYLIVIDFESTCWREKNNYSQEIIEFPAVLLNTATGEVESEFHTYVQPQEHPILSEFCTELTGITQAQVEAGIPLQICLSRFNRWLQHLQLSMGVVFPNRQKMSSASSASQKLCAFLTWSDWDLGVCLQYECKRKQIHKPDVLNSWIDLRSTYKLFYTRKPRGLNGALQDLGIQFAGREHSGLDDSRNTAQLAARMMRDGCVLKITRSLVRTPLKVKPMYGNTTEQNRKEKSNQPSSSKIYPVKSRLMHSRSEVIVSNLDTKENLRSVQEPVHICRSLISPKTLLNGATVPLWKTSTAVTNAPSVARHFPSPHSSSNSLVLCSTTVGCVPNEPHQTLLSETGEAGRMEGEEEENVSIEPEDRCDLYDAVVLEADDDVIGEQEREDDTEYVSELDDEVTARGHVSGNNCKAQKMTSEASTKSLSANNWRSQNNVNKTRQNSTISDARVSFAAPKTVTLDSNQHKSGLKTWLQVQKLSVGPHKNTKTSTPFIPEKTSTPNSSFVRPKAVVTQHTNHKETPNATFTIYTDPQKSSRSSSSSSFRTPKNVLCTLATNTLPSRANCSSNYAPAKGGPRITSPLCACGRRAKRQVVSNGGPNNGRGFYCCPVRRSGSGCRVQKGCEFFKWESALRRRSSGACPAGGSSVSLCQINSTLSCCPPQKPTARKSY